MASRDVTCSICSNQLEDPKLLPCFHTFCRPCMRELSVVNAEELTIECPTCHDKHSVLSSEGLDAFPDNLALQGVLDGLRVHKTNIASSGDGEDGKDTAVCGNGVDDNPATGYCFDCRVNLCDSCWALHKKMVASKDHATSSLEDIKQGSAVVPQAAAVCKEHKGEPMKLYCVDCSQVICRDCAITTHRKHEYEYLADCRSKADERLTELQETLRKKTTETEKQLTAVKKMLRTNVEQSKTCQQNIDSTCDNLVELVDTYRETLLTQLQQNMEVAQTHCRSVVNEIELIRTKLTSARTFIERLQSCGDYAIINVSKGDLLDRAETLTDFSVKKFSGTPLLVHNKPVEQDFQCFERDLPKLGPLEPRDIHVYKPGAAVPEVSISLSGNITGGVVPLMMVQVSMEVDSEMLPCDVADDYVRNYWKAKFKPLDGDHEYKVDVVVAGVKAPSYSFMFNPAHKRRGSLPLPSPT